jgi:hypothetical protein
MRALVMELMPPAQIADAYVRPFPMAAEWALGGSPRRQSPICTLSLSRLCRRSRRRARACSFRWSSPFLVACVGGIAALRWREVDLLMGQAAIRQSAEQTVRGVHDKEPNFISCGRPKSC